MQIVPSIYTAVPRRKKIGIFRRKGKYCKTVPLAIWHADLVLMWEYHATPLVQCQIIMNTSLRYILGTVKTSMIKGTVIKTPLTTKPGNFLPREAGSGLSYFFLGQKELLIQGCWKRYKITSTVQLFASFTILTRWPPWVKTKTSKGLFTYKWGILGRWGT